MHGESGGESDNPDKRLIVLIILMNLITGSPPHSPLTHRYFVMKWVQLTDNSLYLPSAARRNFSKSSWLNFKISADKFLINAFIWMTK